MRHVSRSPRCLSLLALSSVIAAAGSACAHRAALAAHEPSHWTYKGDSGPDRWGALSADAAPCAAGTRQSPIDIAAGVGATAIETSYPSAGTELVHNGHTIQLNAAPGNTLSAGGATFELLQLHFHSPSEHTIAGRHYPLEAHFVHRGADGGLAVVGLLFREGEADPRIAEMWRTMPAHAGGAAAPVDIPLNSLWRPAGAFANYDGSLTTPPCTEGVRWFVAEAAATVSRDQVAAFVAAAGENARPVQPLNGRVIRLP